ncbi:MAG: hypothetical protein VYD19_01180, partial [Myxococcota bacterium]|nr:hypothetical protein [Myxococcota bacterium]
MPSTLLLMVSSRTLGVKVWVSLSLGLTCISSVTLAQVVPEVIILLDSSTSMGRVPSQDAWPTCREAVQDGRRGPNNVNGNRNAAPALPENPAPVIELGAARESRLHVAQSLLSGSQVGPVDCLSYTPVARERFVFGADQEAPFARPLCAMDGARPCGAADGAGCDWIPCGEDYGTNGQDPFSGDHPPHFNSDGLINRANGRIRFAFMSSEGETAHNAGRSGGYSYGEKSSRREVQRFIDGRPLASDSQVGLVYNWESSDEGRDRSLVVSGVEWLSGVDRRSIFSDQGSPWMNLGARNLSSPFGGMIFGGLGEPGAPNLPVGEDPAAVSRHNLLVTEKIRSTIPHGPLSLSALLIDLEHYLDEQEAEDPNYACRRRAALLVSDGRISNLMPPLSCSQDADCGFGDTVGRCVESPLPLMGRDELAESPPCAAGECQRLCLFPEGAPFEDPALVARRLYDRGVEVYIMSVGLPAVESIPRRRDYPAALESLYRVAEMGSPNLGADPAHPGLFAGEEAGSIDALLSRLRSGSAVSSSASDAKPLVITPSAADQARGEFVDLRLRQWRLSPQNIEHPGDELEAEIEQAALGCIGEQAQSARPKELERHSYRAMRERQPRDIITLTSTTAGNLSAALTGDGALFSSDGSGGDEAARLTGQRGTPLRRIGRRLQGYFGLAGLPDGPNGGVGQRRYAASRASDLVGLSAPAAPPIRDLNLELPDAQASRPTLVFYGTESGLIHGVRAYDQRPLFSFVPRQVW